MRRPVHEVGSARSAALSTLAPVPVGPLKAWVGVVSRAHVERGVQGGFAQLCHGKRGPLARMSVGDLLLYYSPTTEFRGGEPLKAFTAIGRVRGAEVLPFDMGGGFVPFRREIGWFGTARDAPVHELAAALDFIRANPNWGMLARRGHFEITLGDALRIARAIGVGSRETKSLEGLAESGAAIRVA